MVAVAQRSDTTVRNITTPRHAAGGNLIREWEIGGVDGAVEYQFTRIQDVFGASDGSVWVIDGQFEAGTIRQFSAAGQFIRQIGRQGNGPGEYRSPLSVTQLRDGRVVVLDGIGRVLLYALNGIPDTTWTLRTRYRWRGEDILADTSGIVWLPIAIGPLPARGAPAPPVTQAYLRLGSDGRILDTVIAPTLPVLSPPPVQNMPFYPRNVHALSPTGSFATGVTTRFAVNLHPSRGRAPWRNGDPIVQLRPASAPVSMSNAEREDRRRFHEAALQRSGVAVRVPELPRVKPAFTSIRFDIDGRLWLSVSSPSRRMDAEERSRLPESVVQLGWLQSQSADVFDVDGSYLGRVTIPDVNFARSRGDRVWAVAYTPDDYVPSVLQYRLVWKQ
jgi:hypothetical protein